MGLVTNIEYWDMSAAIGMATEGVRAKYNVGSGGGGFGAADMEIASKLDGGKVLVAVHQMGQQFENLELWSMFAYASPNWNRSGRSKQLFEYVINDWVFECAEQGNFIQIAMFDRIKAILPLVAGGLALEQLSGADISNVRGDLVYHPVADRKAMIHALVELDCTNKGEHSESFVKKRTRYYQTNWARFSEHIERLKNIMVRYDTLARKIYKKQLEKQMMSI
ncbi:hypothetical protein [Vibrio sp. E150_018]